MPTYDYACRLCEHEFEVFQSMTEDRLLKCPSCGKEGLKRLIGTGAGIIFKGSGFYETDYKRKSSNGDSSSKSEKPTKDDKSTSSASSEAKKPSEPSSSSSKSDT